MSHGHNYLTYQGNSHSVFGNNSRFNGIQSPTSPPFIIKINNIPSFFALHDIQDLFQSRFMKFIKLKLFWEVDFNILNSSSNPLDSINQRKKVAFVELETYQDSDKVIKWTNLNLDRGMGRLMVHVGNFNDFKVYNDLNQQIPENMDPSLPIQENHSRFGQRRQRNSFNQPHPFHNNNSNNQTHHFNDQNQSLSQTISQHEVKQHESHELPPLIQPKPATISKSNPFGKAKPVDTLRKELELEEKLHDLQINKTTFKTLGSIEQEESRRKSVPEQQKQQKPQKQLSVAPQPTSSSQPTPQPTSSTPTNQKLAFKKDISKLQGTKSISLIPALKPEIEAWGSTSLLDTTSPPTSNKNSPTQPFAKIASPSLNDRLKHENSHNLSNQVLSKKTILKRKTPDNRKSRIVLKKDVSSKIDTTPMHTEGPEITNDVNNKVENKFEEVQVPKTEELKSQTQQKIKNNSRSNQKGSKLKKSPIVSKEPTPSNNKHESKSEQKSKQQTEPKPKPMLSKETTEPKVDKIVESNKSNEPSSEPGHFKTEFDHSSRGGGRGRDRGTKGVRGRGRLRASLSERVWVRNTDNEEKKPDAKDESKQNTKEYIKPEAIEPTISTKEQAKSKVNEALDGSNNTETTVNANNRTSNYRGSFKRGSGRGRGKGRGTINAADRVYNRKDTEQTTKASATDSSPKDGQN